MTRIFLSFLVLLLFQFGFSSAFAQTYSLHMIPGDQARGGADRQQQRADGGNIVGSLEKRQHVRGDQGYWFDGGQVVEQQSFTSLNALIAAHRQMSLDMFGVDFVPCLVPDQKSTESVTEMTAAGGAVGADGMPEGFGNGWAGAGKGGCGTWATAMCNRILGKKSGKVTKAEWNEIAAGISQGADGGSSSTNRAAYYAGLGCKSGRGTFDGSQESYAVLKEALKRGYDVKLSYYKKVTKPNGDVEYENGHVETVTGVTTVGGKSVALVNSWGDTAQVSGGTDNNFSHSQQGANLNFASGTWPSGTTHVDVTIVGDCE